MNPLVSIVIPVYNGERFITRALSSVLEQSYRPIEIIVVDDGSTDDSPNICQAVPEARYTRQSNAGVASARNHGIRLSKGRYIAFLDQDDEWLPQKLEVQVGLLEQNKEYGFTIARQQIVFLDNVPRPPWLPENVDENELDAYLPGTMVARRELFEIVGMFDSSYVNASDTDWVMRAHDRGACHAIVPQVLLIRRVHANNASHELHRTSREVLRVLRERIRRRRGQGRPNHS